ncbi:MAG: 5-(carboxyamino)imidazole ribonucleotide synthase [Solitalea-like symbiont of Tyrophagus putrescentiae]
MDKLRTNLLKLGILGGGQLGRMLTQSAMDYSFESVDILDHSIDSPCNIFSNLQIGDIKDFDSVYNFGKNKNIITIEIENVNTDALKKLQKEGKKIFPQPEVIEIIKNKALQKQFYAENNIPTANFYVVDSDKEIINYKDNFPLVQKSQLAGYDGKGVYVIKDKDDIDNCLKVPSILEEMVAIKQELSIIVARSIDGQVKMYPIVEMHFNKESNLLEYLVSPANISISINNKITELAKRLASLLQIVGIFAIELFVTKNDEILVNEIAPRVHNSGHHTKGGFISSQFDSHIRAISGLPINDMQPIYKYCGMVNILGGKGYSGLPVYNGMYKLLEYNNIALTLYGKTKTSPYRKLGHISIFDNDQDSFINTVDAVLKTTNVTSI